MKIKVKVVGIAKGTQLAFVPEGKPQAWLDFEAFEGDEAKSKKYRTTPYFTEIEVEDERAEALGWV